MYESGYYPAGAEFDPRAPWNEVEPTMVECEACEGKGYHWYKYNIVDDHEEECTEEEWEALPDGEDEAEALGLTYIKGEKETCDVCDGEGEVEYEYDYYDYYDYYDED